MTTIKTHDKFSQQVLNKEPLSTDQLITLMDYRNALDKLLIDSVSIPQRRKIHLWGESRRITKFINQHIK